MRNYVGQTVLFQAKPAFITEIADGQLNLNVFTKNGLHVFHGVSPEEVSPIEVPSESPTPTPTKKK